MRQTNLKGRVAGGCAVMAPQVALVYAYLRNHLKGFMKYVVVIYMLVIFTCYVSPSPPSFPFLFSSLFDCRFSLFFICFFAAGILLVFWLSSAT
jgi:asparagine N-glycosylation enzyme membrane subunit Stt3